MRLAAETVIEAFFFVDREAWRLFLVERAQALVLTALARQLDLAPDNIDQAGPAAQFVKKLIGKCHLANLLQPIHDRWARKYRAARGLQIIA